MFRIFPRRRRRQPAVAPRMIGAGHMNRTASQRHVHIALTCMLAIVNVLLISENLRLRGLLSAPAIGDFREIGDHVPPLQGLDRDGEAVTFHYDSGQRSTLLLFLSPSCSFCTALFPHWQELMTRARQDGYRVIVVAREDEDRATVDEYLARWHASHVNLVYASKETIEAYGLYATPITVVVTGPGIIRGIWVGMWDHAQMEAVNKRFGTSFEEMGGGGGQR